VIAVPVAAWVKRPVVIRMCGPWDGSTRSAREIGAFVGPGPGGFPGFRPPGRDGAPAAVWDVEHDSWIAVLPGQYVAEGVDAENYPIDPGVRDRTYRRVPAWAARLARAVRPRPAGRPRPARRPTG
jgi:hypothetical protein